MCSNINISELTIGFNNKVVIDCTQASSYLCWDGENQRLLGSYENGGEDIGDNNSDNQKQVGSQKEFWLLYILMSDICSVQFSSVTQSCPTLCDPMDCSMPGLPVHHQLSESTQTHIHWVGDATQPSHPLLSPSLPALNPSQHQGLFK